MKTQKGVVTTFADIGKKQPSEKLYKNIGSEKIAIFTRKHLYRCFPVNIEKFLRTLFLNNICKRLLLIGVQRIELTFCSDYLLGNLIKKRLRHRCFLWIWESCKNMFFIEKPLVAASYDGLNLQDFLSLELFRVVLFLLFFQCFFTKHRCSL